jgi:hypothetical protein
MTLVGITQDAHCSDCAVDTTAVVTDVFDVDVNMELACCGRTVEALIVDVVETLYDDCGV